MNTRLALLLSSLQKIDRRHLQLLFVIVSLAMLVIGAGAPADAGGVGK